MTFFEGSCSGNRLPRERRVGRLRITPTWPPFGAGAAISTVWRYSRSRNAGCAIKIIASSWASAGAARAKAASARRLRSTEIMAQYIEWPVAPVSAGADTPRRIARHARAACALYELIPHSGGVLAKYQLFRSAQHVPAAA